MINASGIQLLCETSWEVCNKIGGIYTVLSTKAESLGKLLSKKLIFIGPDLGQDVESDFEECDSLLGLTSSDLSLPHDIRVRFGYWKVAGNPQVVLVKFNTIYPLLNEIFAEMWDEYKVDSLHEYGDYREGCAFGIAAAMTIEALAVALKVDTKKVFAHFDEWTTSMGMLYLQIHMPEAATIFTTHATSIGRSICGNGKQLYEYFDGYHGFQMAKELNMEAKHSLEQAAAANADCFTTVSAVTARECRQLLDVMPQVVTPNGFEPAFVPKGQHYCFLREKGRRRLLDIATQLTGKSFANDTFIIATSGRNEYRNKGLDLFTDALMTLNGTGIPAGKSVLGLVLVPGWVKEPLPRLADLMAGKEEEEIRGFSTHVINNPDSDPLYRRLAEVGVNNSDDRMSLILVPCYLDGNDGIINIKYYDLLPAIDATVFASYYEPWGYTPLESVAFGIPTVTTDKAGFGAWILESDRSGFLQSGVEVIGRNDTNYSECCRQIAESLAYLISASQDKRDKITDAARSTARRADWSGFIAAYMEAFDIADKRRDDRISHYKKS